MEKLSLKKFEDFQIDKQGLKTVQGGMDVCTGGGFDNVYHRDGKSYILFSSTSYTSDVLDRNGNKTLFGVDIKFYN
jgi:natural product precursor